MNLLEFLAAGGNVAGSKFDNKIKPLLSMSLTAQKRRGYIDKDEYRTPLGEQRETTRDINALELATKERLKSDRAAELERQENKMLREKSRK